ncbi:MAG: hypothetical protein NTX50_24950, partial [Candidatus Sumerlaeota bacterium]|nr:hypothetical protein [Candidatus Sumerlaeota bacterium]
PDATGAEESDDNLVRTDYHRDCWKQVRKGDYLSFWLAKRPEPPVTPKMTRQERNTILLGLFSALIQKSDTIDEPAKFIVSHLLMKYKVLMLAGSRVDEQQRRRWIIFEIRQTEEKFEVPDIRLSDEQAAETLARINAYLDQAHAEAAAKAPQLEDEEQEEA